MEQNQRGVHVFGYLYLDHYYNGNLTDFLERFENEPFLVVNSKKLGFDDLANKKVSIDKSEESNFRDYIENKLRPKGLIVKDISGGGGKNSRKALDEIKVGGEYWDTCSPPNPSIGDGLIYPTHYAGISNVCDSLIIEDSSGGTAVKTNRNDNNKECKLAPKSIKKLDELANSGLPILVNSFSNPEAIDRITSQTKGGIYSVITKSLPIGSTSLNQLLHKSKALFFSGKEFYYNQENEKKYDELSNGNFNRATAKKILNDMENFAYDLGITCPIVVTLGENGAIVYSNKGDSSERNHVILKPEIGEDVKEHVKKYNKTTNTSGDTMEAVTTHVYANHPGNTLTFSVKAGSREAVRQVLGYNVHVNDYQTIEL